MPDTTTIRVRRDTRERLKRLASERGISAPDLISELVARAEDDALFAQHAAAYDELRAADPALMREIDAEDRTWEQSSLTAPPART